MSEDLKIQDSLALRLLFVIERIAGGDFSEELEMRSYHNEQDPMRWPMTETEKIANKKFSLIYMLAHAFNHDHSCHRVHEDWRKMLDKAEEDVRHV